MTTSTLQRIDETLGSASGEGDTKEADSASAIDLLREHAFALRYAAGLLDVKGAKYETAFLLLADQADAALKQLEREQSPNG